MQCYLYLQIERIAQYAWLLFIGFVFDLQGARQSMAYFSCCRDSTIIQGPKKKYPPTTFPEILEKTSDFVKNMDTEKMTNEEYLAYQNKAVLGPALQPEA